MSLRSQEELLTELRSGHSGLRSFAPHLPGYIALIDEPEAGLHRSAEPVLARALARLTTWSGVKVIAATHSPAFVREFTAIGGHVDRTHEDLDFETVIDECGFSDLESTADAIGVDPIDILQLVRLFVCVEGAHDKTILEELFGEELARYGIYVVALRGARGLSQVAQSNILWNVTDAHFVVLLDGIIPDEVQELLSESRLAFDTSPQAALDVLARLESEHFGAATERKALRELFFEAVQSGRLHRINCDGLPRRDILEYLDPRQLVQLDTATEYQERSADDIWKALQKQWRRDQRLPRQDFKSWLSDAYPGTDFNDERIRRAVRLLDKIHPDLRAVLARLTELTTIPLHAR